MVRVHESRAAALPVRTGALRHAKTDVQRKPSYKVILEEMTEKKKKLHTTLCFRTEAPPGYTFVAAGDPKVTLKCKELSRAQGVKVYIVSTSSTGFLSEQVGRVGYHFPSNTVNQACRLLGVKLAKSGKVDFELESCRNPIRHSRPGASASQMKGKKLAPTTIDLVEDEMSQKELDAQATSAIRELFPRIPEKDIKQIVTRAFRKGTAKVGTATDQPFIRRVHLAVGAHIRHMYTDYDSLLRTHKHNWLDARAMVQPVTLDKIIEWRDEKDEPDAVEDILREVIVIPDDEKDESDDDQASDRHESVEVISSHAYADNVHIQPIDYGALDDENRLNRQMSPEDDWAPSVRFIRRISPPAEKRQRYQDRVDRQHAHRTRVWQEAVSRRKITAQTSHDTARHSMYNPHDQRLAPSNPPYSELASSDLRAHESGPGFPKLKSAYADADSSQPSVAPRNVPRNVRNADDRGQSREYWQLGRNMHETLAHMSVNTNRHEPENRLYVARGRFDNGEAPPRVLNDSYDTLAKSQFVPPDSERLIPSIESEPQTLHSQELLHQRAAPGFSDRQFQDRLVGPRILELEDDPQTPTLKRRRIEDLDKYTTVPSQGVIDRHIIVSAPLSYRPSGHDGYANPESAPSGVFRPQASGFEQGLRPRMDMVPITRPIYTDEVDRPTKARSRHLVAGDARASQPMRGPHFDIEPSFDSPLRRALSHEGLPAIPPSRSLIENPQLPPGPHNSRQLNRHPFHRLPASYGNQAMPRSDYTQLGAGRNASVENIPMRLRSVHHNDLGSSMHSGDRPARYHSGRDQHVLRASDTEAPFYMRDPARHSRDYAHSVGHIPQSLLLLSPGRCPARGAHLYDEARPVNDPPNTEAAGPRNRPPNHEVVYISSSPPGEERYAGSPQLHRGTSYRVNTISHHQVDEDGRQVNHNHYSIAHQAYGHARGSNQYLGLDR